MAPTNSQTMPQFFPFADDPNSTDRPQMTQEEPPKPSHRQQSSTMWDKLSLHKLGGWLKKEDGGEPPPGNDESAGSRPERPGMLGRRLSGRKVVPGLPRPLTFRRQNSEKRDRLLPVDPDKDSKRALSAGRFRSGSRRTLSPAPVSTPSLSAPDVRTSDRQSTQDTVAGDTDAAEAVPQQEDEDIGMDETVGFPEREHLPPLSTTGDVTEHESDAGSVDEFVLQQELEAKWILNLSMHFRDQSDREKFFITYAEEPNKWRRVTVSCDYRNVTPDSLEADLKSLHYQRDKSSRVYESIRDSLPDIQFYDTVTNLKLETDDGRLHVHVTEDVNEIIPYPPTSAVSHLPGPRFLESAVNFESHISGFVYKVSVENRTYIKKEIPGPDTVEEFLYENNALSKLQNSRSVIKYEGLIVDDKGEHVKGLLISYAEQGALVDMIFDFKNTDRLPWGRRERWAKQIVQGLSEIHEAGFVQGDFTLSNIVVDASDDAKIIDINRRGCPVGWEPPELTSLIERNQRVSIYIGVKSDVFQLGMVLWALMEEEDEPERQERPLEVDQARDNIPGYFKEIVAACLSTRPEDRPSPKDLLSRFPEVDQQHAMPLSHTRHSLSTHRSDKEYIDPSTAVDLEDIDLYRRGRALVFAENDIAFPEGGDDITNRTSTSYRDNSSGYSLVHGRSGSPTSASALTSPSRRHYDYSSGPNRTLSMYDSDADGVGILGEKEHGWEKIYVDSGTRVEQRTNVGGSEKELAAAAEHLTYKLPPPLAKEDTIVRGYEMKSQTEETSDRTPRRADHFETPNDGSPKHVRHEKMVEQTRPDLAPAARTTQIEPDGSPPLLPHERVSPIVPTPSQTRTMASLDDSKLSRIPNDLTPTDSARKMSLDLPALSRALGSDSDGPPTSHGSGSGGTFAERIHHRSSHDSPLANLVTEVLSVSTPAPIERRDSRLFGPPLHHDSGFHEPSLMPSLTSDSPVDWEDKTKPERVDEAKRMEQREERRKKSAELDEQKVREGIQEVLRSVNGNAGKTSTEGEAGQEDNRVDKHNV